MTTKDLLLALLGAVAGVLLQLGINGVKAFRQFHGQEFSGTRYLVLPEWKGKAERIDLCRIRQDGQKITAKIRRLSPPGGRKRKWKLVGYSHGNVLVGVFYPVSKYSDSTSYGALVLHRDPDVRECSVWKGYYVRPDLYGLQAIITADIARWPAVLQEWNPGIRNFGKVAERDYSGSERTSES